MALIAYWGRTSHTESVEFWVKGTPEAKCDMHFQIRVLTKVRALIFFTQNSIFIHKILLL